MTGQDCDADVSTALLLDRARRVALDRLMRVTNTAIERAIRGEEWDGEKIMEGSDENIHRQFLEESTRG